MPKYLRELGGFHPPAGSQALALGRWDIPGSIIRFMADIAQLPTLFEDARDARPGRLARLGRKATLDEGRAVLAGAHNDQAY